MPDAAGGRARLEKTDRTGLRAPAAPSGPLRTCIGCRGTDSRSILLRVVAETHPDGLTVLVPDPRRRAPGRGAWLHPDLRCFDLAVRRRAFARALRCSPGGIDDLRSWVADHAQR
ncbi:YlxR family protein [Janibacter melonis]|uniref:YlxR family protein n=1 Tax=Janibacter melonis TaxID=262209 RepID=UPI0017833B01|nr:YlxR family protein [Janibacter melonis]